MSSDINEALDAARAIIRDAEARLDQIVTEEDAKIQVILRMLVEALGWKHSDLSAEVAHENGYSDFIVSDQGTPAFLLEAKRAGKVAISSSDDRKLRRLKLSGPTLDKCDEGITQAASYAGPNGIPVAVLTDGMAWIIFKPVVPGIFYKEKKAFVFPSFAAVLDDFSNFYDLLAKRQFQKKMYRREFDAIHEGRGALEHPLVPAIPESEIRISQKSPLAFDLDKVFSSFFSKITDEQDSDMLIDCFVESRESRIADYSLEKMAASVLGNIIKDRDVDAELASLIESAVDIDQGETVFIVGPTGAGKSTFLDRFFEKTLDRVVRKRCLVAKVDCLDSLGVPESGAAWLVEALISSIEAQLFDDGVPSWDNLQGLYHLEYLKRLKGVDKHLYDRDKQAFKVKFGEVIEGLVQKDREGYLKRLLNDVVSNRKMLPIIVLDNTDEFSLDYKATLFQFVQALRRHVTHCLIFFPVTDKSAWSFSKTDIYGIYMSRSFFLPTPPPREVFRKRVDYLRKKIDSEIQKSHQGNYFSRRGIAISVEDLGKFAGVLEDVFVDQDYASRMLGELSNYNIRRTLLLSKRVITSAVFDVDEIVKSYVTGQPIATNFAKFMNALLRGDYELFRQSDTHEVFPIFRVDGSIRQSPLMSVRVLSLLSSQRANFREIDRQHLTVQSIFDYFDAIGATEAAVDTSLLWLLEGRLIEPYDSSVKALSPAQRVSISYGGDAHLRMASSDKVFIEQMALTTSLRNEETALKLRGLYKQRGDFSARMEDVRREFVGNLLAEDALYIDQDVRADQYANQATLLERLARIGGLVSEASPSEPIFQFESSENVNLRDCIAEVEWFDVDRGYGFVRVDGIDEGVFLHLGRLEEAEVPPVAEGDVIRCAIIRNAKGLSVSQVLSIESSSDELDDFALRVVKVVRDRGFGFARIEGGTQDVFFAFSQFPESVKPKLDRGFDFRAKISSDREGRLQVRLVV
jgi:cold shock CspA family protein